MYCSYILYILSFFPFVQCVSIVGNNIITVIWNIHSTIKIKNLLIKCLVILYHVENWIRHRVRISYDSNIYMYNLWIVR